MITISKVQSGSVVDYAFLTETQWEAINYLDYVDMDELEDFYRTHGDKVVDKMISFFDYDASTGEC